jgi:hypothetical protein
MARVNLALACGARRSGRHSYDNEDMSFHTYARQVRRIDLPFKVRRKAFRSCIGQYHGLIREKFQFTDARFCSHFGFNADISEAEANERLTQAMASLEAERNLFLERLRLFEKRRIKEKMRGRRSPTKSALKALYQYNRLTSSDIKSESKSA